MAARINDDGTINIDPEGISMSSNGGFWVVSEGRGTAGDEKRPLEHPNLLLELDSEAKIIQCITPDDSFQPQLRYAAMAPLHIYPRASAFIFFVQFQAIVRNIFAQAAILWQE